MNNPVSFPKCLYKKLGSNNNAHTKAPCCQIFVSGLERDQEFDSQFLQFLFLQISETHRVALKLIQNKGQIGPVLKKTAFKFDHNINKLMLFGHGTTKTVFLGNDELTVDDLASFNFDLIHPNGEIYLLACQTGQDLAKQLADRTKRPVFAPLTAFESKDIFLSGDARIRTTTPFVRVLNNGQLVQYFHFSPSKMNDLYKSKLQQHLEQCGTPHDLYLLSKWMKMEGLPELSQHYLKLAAEQGCPIAQYTLGWHLELNGKVEECMSWYYQAAEQGVAPAQNRLGLLLKNTEKIKEAIDWFQQASEQEYAPAQNNLGVMWINDKPAEAENLIRQAAVQGNAVAQNNLGSIYMSDHRTEDAKQCYRLAAEQNYDPAKYNLASILKNEGREEEAKKWFDSAARTGLADDRYLYGFILSQ